MMHPMDIKITRPEPAFTDERGVITDIINASGDGISHIGIITFTEGAIRANHYHKESDQYDYILKGSIELRVKPADNQDAPHESHVLQEGDLVFIPRNTIHAYKALEESSMLDCTSQSRAGTGYEDDTIRVDSLFE